MRLITESFKRREVKYKQTDLNSTNSMPVCSFISSQITSLLLLQAAFYT